MLFLYPSELATFLNIDIDPPSIQLTNQKSTGVDMQEYDMNSPFTLFFSLSSIQLDFTYHHCAFKLQAPICSLSLSLFQTITLSKCLSEL